MNSSNLGKSDWSKLVSCGISGWQFVKKLFANDDDDDHLRHKRAAQFELKMREKRRSSEM